MEVKLYKNKSRKNIEKGNYTQSAGTPFAECEGGMFRLSKDGLGFANMKITCDEIREYIGDSNVSVDDIFEALSLLNQKAVIDSADLGKTESLLIGTSEVHYEGAEFKYAKVFVDENHGLLYSLFFCYDGEGSLTYQVLNYIHEKFGKMKDDFFKRYSITKEGERK